MSSPARLCLGHGDYRLEIEPARGGALARFDWAGKPLFRPTAGATPFDVACFPLIPFSNRIADGRFAFDGRAVTLSRNVPGAPDDPHPLHGLSWRQPWSVLRASESSAVLEHHYQPGDWPWPYRARQQLRLSAAGFSHELSVTNLADQDMPAGLGLHPYFPRNAHTLLHGLHEGEWINRPDGIPVRLDARPAPIDWWGGHTVEARAVDTLYSGRRGDIDIVWPDRGLRLTIRPSSELPHTVIYTPAGADFFCVEPVSHFTNAVNAPEGSGLVRLRPGETLSARVLYVAVGSTDATPSRARSSMIRS